MARPGANALAALITGVEVAAMWRDAIRRPPRPNLEACERMAEHLNLRFARLPDPQVRRTMDAYGVLIEYYHALVQHYGGPGKALIEPSDDIAEAADTVRKLLRYREKLRPAPPPRKPYRRHAALIWLLARADLIEAGAAPPQGGQGARKTSAAVRFTAAAIKRLGYARISEGALAAFLQQRLKDGGGTFDTEAMRDLANLGLGVRLRRLELRLRRVGLALEEKQTEASR